MSLLRKIKRAIRGEVAPKTVVLEVARRGHASVLRRRERASLERIGKQPARLGRSFSRMQAAELLNHFQYRTAPSFLPGFAQPLDALGKAQRTFFLEETSELLAQAERIVNDHSWPLLGLGETSHGAAIDWHRDPLSGITWPLEYHADMNLFRGDGSDARMLWELNRFPHFITLARAYAVTNDERFSVEFFQQVESWHSQNPYGSGANWNCAMEVALRAMNLLAAFEIFRRSQALEEQTLGRLLALFDQHGTFIRQNLEFSYIANSNHYLSDVTGLVWLGVMLPELESAASWRDFGLREMLREMDKQVLPDGADFESSTGYHRFVLELFLYTFVLCRVNGIEIEEQYWQKLYKMLRYVRAYLRPDSHAPLIGDSDSGQVLPIRHRRGDDHAYVLGVGAAVFNDSRLKDPKLAISEELGWILGEQGVATYQKLNAAEASAASEAFPDAGTYILRDKDLYLFFNASSAGISGRGSHGHNDALGIEVSACGRAFIVDPGSYVYTADLHKRQTFRSTAYHSTVEVDGVEQNITDENMPFVIGDEAHPKALLWETGPESDRVVGEHYGYRRLPDPVVHHRTVIFNKRERWWLVEDEFLGAGEHNFSVRFHFDSGLEVSLIDNNVVCAYDKTSESKLLVGARDVEQAPDLETQSTSRDYHARSASTTACWKIRAQAPNIFRWIIVPVCESKDARECLGLIAKFSEQIPD